VWDSEGQLRVGMVIHMVIDFDGGSEAIEFSARPILVDRKIPRARWTPPVYMDKESNLFDLLPQDVLANIFEYAMVKHFSLVCCQWNTVCKFPHIQ
jgi:hypothetical protein